ncbi:MAG: zinc-binding dehydrogenase [Thaumarchaeota archaeon]|nr:zinc-binding dehydrogenase [Nitrososphaerota archaeon]
MKAAVFYGPGDLRVEEVEKPKPGPGEILVKTSVALTCGTDLKTYLRGYPFTKPPLIMGHEYTGVVEEVGEGVDWVKPGDRIVTVNSAPCGYCIYCKLGKPNLCERLMDQIIGFTVDGAYAEYVKVPPRVARFNLYHVAEDVEPVEAALLEPFSCVVRGQRLIKIDLGDTVAIIGAGPIGLMHLLLAQASGSKKTIIIDISPDRLKFAERLGADVTINNREENAVERVREETNGIGADVVIEAVGRVETWEQSLSLARRGGKILLFGGCPSGTKASFDTYMIHYGELTIQGSFHLTPQDVLKAMRIIESKKLPLKKLITREARLDEIVEMFNRIRQGKELKVAIRF